MLFLLFGQDTYRSHERAMAIRDRYFRLHATGTNFRTFRGDEDSPEDLQEFLLSTSLFPEKKFALIHSATAKKTFAEICRTFIKRGGLAHDPNTILLFLEEKPSPHDPLLTILKTEGRVQEFPLLKPPALRAWLKRRTAERGGTISHDAVEELLLRTGPDLWRASQEIEKLVAGGSGAIDTALVYSLVAFSERTPFLFIDAVAERERGGALAALEQQILSGTSEDFLFLLLVRHFRQLLAACHARGEMGDTHIRDALAALSPHLFLRKKILAQSQRWDTRALGERFSLLAVLEAKRKSGKVDSRLALTQFVLAI